MNESIGLSWLGGRKWAEITRDERLFCAHLYMKILDHPDGISRFVRVVNDVCGLGLNEKANWELGYEVCFYRDLQFHDPCRFNRGLSLKRTFDLCLFSDDVIVIIEAKAYQEFDLSQTDDFLDDIGWIKDSLGLPVDVFLVPLASSIYEPRYAKSEVSKRFNRDLLTWRKIADKYAMDEILIAADAVYGRRPKANSANKDYLEGCKLLDLYYSGEVDPNRYWIGRGQGLPGLRTDVNNQEWRERLYETLSSAPKAPNRNWFSLEDFAVAVGASKK